MVPCPVAVEAFQVDQVRCSTPRPASAHVMMIEDGSLDSACGGTVTQLAETPGSDEGASGVAGVAGVGLASVAGLATGAELADADGLALTGAEGVPDLAGVACLAAAARAAEDASLAALVPCAPHAETARVSPASEQAVNAIRSEREVFMPSTTQETRRRLRSVWLGDALGSPRRRGINALRRSAGVLTMGYINTRTRRASQSRRMQGSHLYSLLEAALILAEVPV